MSHGMGFWFSIQTENLLLGIKGNIRAFRSPEPNFFQGSVLHFKHSQKPQKFRSMIERATKNISNVQRIELFGRKRIEGWDVWGNEVASTIELLGVSIGKVQKGRQHDTVNLTSED